jgi:hypothetical protein
VDYKALCEKLIIISYSYFKEKVAINIQYFISTSVCIYVFCHQAVRQPNLVCLDVAIDLASIIICTENSILFGTR